MKNKSYWIWNYGDYEIYHSNLANSRRQEYGADCPVFWKYYDVDKNVKFVSDVTAESDGYIILHLCGIGCISVDGERFASGKKISISKGNHKLSVCVCNTSGLPAAFIESDVCSTGEGWYSIDTGIYSCSEKKKMPVGFDKQYDCPEKTPEHFIFSSQRINPQSKEYRNGGILFDFGRELFGYLTVQNVKPSENIHVSYGESLEEAIDMDFSILFEDISGKSEYKLRQRAFRYIFLKGGENAEVYADFEYLPLEYKGSFKCDNDSVNKIWDMCAYTLKLTSREVLLEAVKRDRWLWGGDAYQAFKFSNYLFFDKDIVRRSIIALRGKEPFDEHINTIIDYSFYWVLSLYEYYMTYKDDSFLKFIYPKAVSLMNFCADRVNGDGFIIGKGNDWTFIDWSDLDKDGAVCAEQMLWIAANRAMAKLSVVVGEDGGMYSNTEKIMIEKVNKFYWNSEKGAYIDCYESGKNHVTRHANIFAVMYDIATPEQRESIIKNVLLNDSITKITTPYFEGYELDVMGKTDNFAYIENMINSYWNGMLDLGATTVWEEYDPKLSGAEHYEMYGNKYGKSLCHAWGASPIYLLGRYYLGVYPTSYGYDTFEVNPQLGNFKFIEGTVPINGGEVKVKLTENELKVIASKDGGTLVWNGKKYALTANEEAVLPNNIY